MDSIYKFAQINDEELKSISALEQKINQEFKTNIILVAYEKSN